MPDLTHREIPVLDDIISSAEEKDADHPQHVIDDKLTADLSLDEPVLSATDAETLLDDELVQSEHVLLTETPDWQDPDICRRIEPAISTDLSPDTSIPATPIPEPSIAESTTAIPVSTPLSEQLYRYEPDQPLTEEDNVQQANIDINTTSIDEHGDELNIDEIDETDRSIDALLEKLNNDLVDDNATNESHESALIDYSLDTDPYAIDINAIDSNDIDNNAESNPPPATDDNQIDNTNEATQQAEAQPSTEQHFTTNTELAQNLEKIIDIDAISEKITQQLLKNLLPDIEKQLQQQVQLHLKQALEQTLHEVLENKE